MASNLHGVFILKSAQCPIRNLSHPSNAKHRYPPKENTACNP